MDNDHRQLNINPKAFAPRYVRDSRSGKTYVQYTEDGQWHEYIPMQQVRHSLSLVLYFY